MRIRMNFVPSQNVIREDLEIPHPERVLKPMPQPPLLEGYLAPVSRTGWRIHAHRGLGIGVEVATGETGFAATEFQPAVSSAII